ncbi:MAG: nucleoside hydrolase [Armatimonadota bacterium]
MAIPVILDTDIGTDIDDSWALAMMLKSPELDVKLVVSATFNTPERAKMVAKMLQIAGRTDIPVGIGVKSDDERLRISGWVDDYDLNDYPGTVYKDGVDAMINTIMDSEEPITLICIGPLTNIAEALRRNPEIAGKARFVGMHGSVYKGYEGNPEPQSEYNVHVDIKAAQQVFTADWDMTITPLDTCGLIFLDGNNYRTVRDSTDPLTKAVIDSYDVWLNSADDNGRSSVLYDTAAIYLAFSEEYMDVKPVNLRVTDDGFTSPDASGKTVRCALEWINLPAFNDLLTRRLTE